MSNNPMTVQDAVNLIAQAIESGEDGGLSGVEDFIQQLINQKTEVLSDRLQAIIDWADFAIANPVEFNKHGVRNLEGPVFDAARDALATVAPQPAPDLALREALEKIRYTAWQTEKFNHAQARNECASIAEKALAATPQPKQPDERDAVIADLVWAAEDAVKTLGVLSQMYVVSDMQMFARGRKAYLNAALSRARAVSKTEAE